MIEDVKCHVVRCVYNRSCHCTAKTITITLTHDEESEKEYVECETMILEE